MYLQQSAPLSPLTTPSTRSSSRSSSMHLVEYDYDEPKPAKKLLAKATYDNIAESTDELAFRKGEILTVIETDTNGLKGWWLCQLRGRQGICPGNRLKIIQSHDSGCFTLSPASSPCPTIDSTTNLNSPIPSEIYENTSLSGSSIGSQRQGKRRSWHIMPNKVLTPQKCGDVYLYDLLPPSSTRGSSPYQQQPPPPLPPLHQQVDGSETYDVPKPAVPVTPGGTPLDPHQHQLLLQQQRGSWIRTPTGLPPYGSHLLLLHQQSIHSTSSNSSSSLSFHHHHHHHHHHHPQQQQQHPYPHGGPPGGTFRMEESYDVPRSLLSQQQHLTPSSSNSSLLMSESFSLSSSNRSSLANMPDYDVPRRNPVSVRATPPPPAGAPGTGPTPGTPLSASFTTSHHSMSMSSFSSMSTYDVPPAQQQQLLATSKAAHLVTPKELPLELSSALETLARLQNEATTAVTRLLSFVSPNWRVKEKLDPILMDLKLAAVRLRTALHDLAEFGDGALGNATKAEDKGLAHKLKPLVKALRDADKLVHEASQSLDAQGWTLVTLQRPEATQKLQQQLPPDSLDQLIACAQTLTEDVRQTASFIQGNATLLFKRSPPTPPTSCPTTPQTPTGGSVGGPKTAGTTGGTGGEWPEDYDYVSLESKEASARTNAEIRDALPQDLKKNFENVVRNAADAVDAACAEKPEALDPNDKSVLVYYASQTVTHMGYLTQAIDAFLQTVEHNQPPKFFLAYGKFVVLSAHNLVNIGDIVHRNVSRETIKTRVLACADALSEALKTCVGKTKKAAQNFPSVTAVQEMVDSVVDISHLASDLKIAMLEAVQQ
ncbi:breast cancer anti-estrogen resistance protein 1 isoform X2 [Anopheles aquasalis]|uniref:breast cancer anti-estrogen resistance protein 1 isoform X2 n=1 Tax=Anopheles aquasalis TaxID=42839 RepID=UPI00215B6D21|nr:breast cancer anti-estrogen resistance protein 1 isoform X2 [Anopheles aquasalis]XP_050096181.1 breast cancer anti-estrogen resistance protein 1 isoform X2 [Anopheles aquasalis]XP_050096182.1 breast cancer anti-estrogen resistance protein 1 isoform X2 [Anopheles aquasalis]